jgi:tetratricopeptide (TPR) repeat protein
MATKIQPKTAPKSAPKKAAPADSAATATDAAVIRRQLAWTLGILLLLAGGYGAYWWGQDNGWGNPDRAVATKLAKGEAAFVAGRLDEAVAQYQRVVERYPEHSQAVQALTQLATALQQQGRLSEALGALQKLAAKLDASPDKPDLKAYTLLQVAKVRKDLADFDGALQAFNEVRQKHPKTDWSGEAQSGIGSVLQAQRRWPEARKAYEVLVKELPGGFLAAEAQTAIGECYEAEQNPQAALRAYKLVVDKYPSAVWDTAKARMEALKRELESKSGKTSSK